ncbi:MAG: phycobilisome protein [Cyanophyceae cyanobacterium]
MQLSDRAKELIPKARIVSFAGWEERLPATVIEAFQAADNEFRFLCDDAIRSIEADLEEGGALNALDPTKLHLSRQFRDLASTIVTEARGQVLIDFPGITGSGGDLYPKHRAEACWRDFWQFLRCVSYGLAGNSSGYLSQEGLGYMALLYEELQVPLPAMVVGIRALAIASCTHCQPAHENDLTDIINENFSPLIAALEAF